MATKFINFTPLCPSPLPPFYRTVTSVRYGTLASNGKVDLANEATFLDSVGSQLTYDIELPDGTFQGQEHRLLTPLFNEGRSAVFNVSGKFQGPFGAGLRLGGTATEAVLRWDGGAWHVVGGNAEAVGE